MTHLTDKAFIENPSIIVQDIRRVESLLDEIARFTFDEHARRTALIALEIIRGEPTTTKATTL